MITKLQGLNKARELLDLEIHELLNKINSTKCYQSEKTYKMDRYFQQLAFNCHKHFGVSLEEIKGKSRKKDITECRHIIFYLLFIKDNFTLEDIGILIGGRNHATVLHGKNKIVGFLDFNDTRTKEIIKIINK